MKKKAYNIVETTTGTSEKIAIPIIKREREEV